MSPANVPQIFLIGVLRIDNQQVCSAQEFDQIGAFFRWRFECARGIFNTAISQLHIELVKRFIVWHVNNRAGWRVNAITHANPRMVQEFRANPNSADLKIHFLEFLVFNFTRQLRHGDGKKRSLHLAGEDFTQAGATALITENLELVVAAISRQETVQPLDVVPVGVRNKDRQSDRIGTELSLERLAEKSNS